MKKWTAILIAMLFLFSAAYAASGNGNACHVSKDGFTVSYDPAVFRIDELYGHEVIVPAADSESSMMIVPAEMNPEDADSMLVEAVGGFGPDAVVGETKTVETEFTTVNSIQAEAEGIIYRFYLVDDGECVLCITATIPSGEAELYSADFDRMAENIRLIETRTVGGGEESFIEAKYEGEGFSLWYPIGQIEPRAVLGHDGFVPAGSGQENGVYLMGVMSDIAPENADGLLNEATGGFVGDCVVRMLEERTLPGGASLIGAEAVQDGMIYRYYLVMDADQVYCLTAQFPVSGEIDYGPVFDRIAESVEFAVDE